MTREKIVNDAGDVQLIVRPGTGSALSSVAFRLNFTAQQWQDGRAVEFRALGYQSETVVAVFRFAGHGSRFGGHGLSLQPGALLDTMMHHQREALLRACLIPDPLDVLAVLTEAGWRPVADPEPVQEHDNRTSDDHFPAVYVYNPEKPDHPHVAGLYRATGKEVRGLVDGIYRREYENAYGFRLWLDADGNATDD